MSHKLTRSLVCLVLFGISGGTLFAKAKKPPSPTPSPTPAKETPTPPPPVQDPDIKTSLPPEAQGAADDAMKAYQKGDMEGARKNFQKLLEILPDNLFALMNLGAIEYRLKLWDDAEKHLKRAVRLQPEAGKAWLALGALYCDKDRLDEALAALSQAVLYDPKNARAHNYLGVTVGKKGWYSGAEAELQRALELDPNYAEAHFNLALFYLQRTPAAVEMARRHYNRALELGAAPDPLVEKTLGDGK